MQEERCQTRFHGYLYSRSLGLVFVSVLSLYMDLREVMCECTGMEVNSKVGRGFTTQYIAKKHSSETIFSSTDQKSTPITIGQDQPFLLQLQSALADFPLVECPSFENAHRQYPGPPTKKFLYKIYVFMLSLAIVPEKLCNRYGEICGDRITLFF